MTTVSANTVPVRLHISQANGAQWGEDTNPDLVPLLAKNVAALAEVYVRRKHGGKVAVTVEMTNDYVGSILYGSPPEIVEPAAAYLYEHWTDSPLWEEDFDADAFYQANPPTH